MTPRGEQAEQPALEEAAGKGLGVEGRDRPHIYEDTADAAIDNALPYWSVLVLSGAIATLGLALDSAAVVIGAMLVAPLLAPVVGLSLALAMGDLRLALQAGAIVLGSTLAVIATSALLTTLLPFQSVTAEISARARPTTLDLVIAVCSGLVGAVVTVARGHRLSAAIPGVAISVALIPPLGVAGFGIAAGQRRELIEGSLLLFGANLAGIVLSGMAVFLLVGMHRAPVLDAARRWHRRAEPAGLARWVLRSRVTGSFERFGSASARGALVVGFTAVLAIPLTGTLRQLSREVRVERAVEAAQSVLEVPGRTSVLGRHVTLGHGNSRVLVRVATADWVGEQRRAEFERRASALADEPVRLVLEQLPASAGGVDDLADLFPTAAAPTTPALEPLPQLLAKAREQLHGAVLALPFPEGAVPVGVELELTDAGAALLRVAYVSAEPLEPQAAQVLTRALRGALDHPRLEVAFLHLGTEPGGLDPDDPDAAGALAELLGRWARLRLEVLAPDSGALGQAAAALAEAGVPAGRMRGSVGAGEPLRVRLRSGAEVP